MRHPNKHINAAVRYALSKGWTLRKATDHAWGVILCPAGVRGACRKSVLSTPKHPELHARQLRAYVDHCQCDLGEEEEGE